MRKRVIGISFAALLAAGSAWSHHSGAQYDFSKRVSVHGTVKSIDVRNPHLKLVMEVTDEAGRTKEIEFEGESRNNLYRAGWRTTDINVGDELTIGFAPPKDSSAEVGGYIRSFTLANGKEF
jgi:Family of unknown function (DUF6152)